MLHTTQSRQLSMPCPAAQLDDASRVRCSHACTGYTEQADGWVVVHFEGQPDIR